MNKITIVLLSVAYCYLSCGDKCKPDYTKVGSIIESTIREEKGNVFSTSYRIVGESSSNKEMYKEICKKIDWNDTAEYNTISVNKSHERECTLDIKLSSGEFSMTFEIDFAHLDYQTSDPRIEAIALRENLIEVDNTTILSGEVSAEKIRELPLKEFEK